MNNNLAPILNVDTTFARQGAFDWKVDLFACYQCGKCSNGCPVTFAMDVLPHQLIRMLQLGLTEEVLQSKTIWVCASCETCTTRCPNNIDIAHVMDTLRQLATEEGKVAPSEKNAPVFHKEFLSSIKRGGRINELDMIIRYTLKSEGIKGMVRQAGMGLKMLRRGKFKLLPEGAHGKGEVKQIFKRTGGKQ